MSSVSFSFGHVSFMNIRSPQVHPVFNKEQQKPHRCSKKRWWRRRRRSAEINLVLMPLLLDTAHLGLSEGIIKASSSSSSPPFIFLSPLSFLFFKLSLLFPPFISQYGELLIIDQKHTHAHYLLVKITHTGFNKVDHSCIQQLLTLVTLCSFVLLLHWLHFCWMKMILQQGHPDTESKGEVASVQSLTIINPHTR